MISRKNNAKLLISCFTYLFLTALSSCVNNSYNVDNLYYSKSTKRFDNNYKEKVENARKFLKNLGSSYTDAIKDSFPNFTEWDSLPFGDPLKSKATLYISNNRETLLKFSKEEGVEFIVEATDFPIQTSIFHGLDIFYPYNETITAKFAINNYDTASQSVTIAFENFPYVFIGGLNIQNSDKPFAINSGDLFILERIRIEDENKRVYLIQGGMLTDVNGFEQHQHKAEIIGQRWAIRDIKGLLSQSVYFRHMHSDLFLRPLAEHIKERLFDDSIGLKDYTASEIVRDYDSLYKIARKNNVDSAYVSLVKQFTSDPRHRFVFLYSNENDLIMQWVGLNFFILILALILKKIIERKIQKGQKWISGAIWAFNIFISTKYWSYIELSYFLIPWILALTSILYIVYSKKGRQLQTE